ncbi:DNA mismatch repair endonuclease MutL [Pseudanabaena sp. FACHB-2040]|uniref:DNA mismatch repair endonuclease MutL n=1 Tax=Pseudanabaena sp. FACHB-2040 TaxID=2692859 RepID=UPI0016825864|nr:DNA mismatch repair endonuclease MutL [Pseudanabaena sp. FACHB-2040]MBD2257592.1 DNA mismatch repair endonuclease MutL [Pseudanabaena sp. FACHB-2040]
MTSQIQSLPMEVIYQIAAGEVIDSLAAVVRELVENALDAQATRITLALWPDQGQVRVADDGLGMALADLQRAATPHSTSKIRSQADLWQIKSLGFRGQALHSLCQVGVLEICSRPQLDSQASGWRVSYSSQGEPLQVKTVAIAPGTIVTVSDLFAAWPARQQALPSISQQLRAVQLCLQQMALCHPQVTFQAELRGNAWFAIAPAATARERLPQILKTLVLADLRDLDRSVDALPVAESPTPEVLDAAPSHLGSLYLLAGLPDRCHRQRADWIKIAVNGRQVHLPEVEQAVIRAFRFTLPRDRYPICFIHLYPHPNAVDWNRHPDKSAIYLRALDTWNQAVAQAITDLLQLNPESLSQTGQHRRVQQFLKAAESAGPYPAPLSEEAATAPPEANRLPLLKAVAQVQNRYILAEHPGGICLIEQHIAHERVLYEQLEQKWSLVPLNSPIILEQLSQPQIENLQQLQLEIAPFGPQLWAIRTVPAPLAQRQDLANALLELSLSNSFDQVLVAVACRTAIRNGTPLSLETLQTLLQNWQNTRNPYTCPHGRPICLALEETSLARFFKRHWVIGKSHGI